jgi:hypothetical protein
MNNTNGWRRGTVAVGDGMRNVALEESETTARVRLAFEELERKITRARDGVNLARTVCVVQLVNEGLSPERAVAVLDLAADRVEQIREGFRNVKIGAHCGSSVRDHEKIMKHYLDLLPPEKKR